MTSENFQTPMMKQYEKIKSEYPDCILFFRLGDFYELFLEDAEIGSKILGITLTARSKGKDGRIPMCGVPYHAIDNYLARIIKAGYKAAICEQTSDPKLGAEIVEREVIRIVTPGTITDESMLDKRTNNYLLTFSIDHQSISIAYSDISTGEFFVLEKTINSESKNKREPLINEIRKINPSEIILNKELYEDYELIKDLRAINQANIYRFKDEIENIPNHKKLLLDFFNIKSLEIFEINDSNKLTIKSAAELVEYLKYTQKDKLHHIRKIQNTTHIENMRIDSETIRNLEIFYSNRTSETNQSSITFVETIDKTNTSMGARLLRNWIIHPLINIDSINNRQNAVEILIQNHNFRDEIETYLKNILDIERLLSKLGTATANGRDLIAISKSIESGISIIQLIQNSELKLEKSLNLLKQLNEPTIKKLESIHDRINTTIKDDPPVSIKEGNLIKDGINQKLDEIKAGISNSQEWITQLEAKERTRTNISSLKVGFNSVFGYYIEVSKANSHLVPTDYNRKQTLVNSERYITEELKKHEEIVLNAQEQINQIELEVFNETVKQVINEAEEIQTLSRQIAEIDILTGFALTALENNYTKPLIGNDKKYNLVIQEGRHPVIEKTLNSGEFTPNSTQFDKQNAIHIITGPNMAGKSTYIRQVALIQLMAQIGSFVPAYRSELAIVDGIYTRIGAGDALAQGLSTFMVEMIETAKILNNATSNSLIILDEVGRGTSTIDGLSIAKAVVEYIHNKIGAKTLFATHFHELVTLEQRLKKLKNYHIKVIEDKGEIRFLHKVEEGGTNKSYGIEVAKLAGIPQEVVDRAQKLMTENTTPQLKLDI